MNFLAIIALLFASACSLKQHEAKDDSQYFAFAYFTYDNPDAGIRMALSRDGYHWKKLNKYDGHFVPVKNGLGNISDCPSIVKGSDGYYHMVWSTELSFIGYAKSKDLQNWEDARKIDISGGELGKPKAVWAPELFLDPQTKKYSIIFTAFTKKIPGLKNGHKGNHKAFVISTTDFKKFTQPKKLLNPDPKIYYIDPYVLFDKDTYYTFLKVEAHNTKDGEKDGLHYTKSPHLFGPHQRLSATLDRATGDAEGPTVMRLKDHWLMLYDTGFNRRGALASNDLKLWIDVTDEVEFPEGYRHGTAIKIDAALYRDLEQQFR